MSFQNDFYRYKAQQAAKTKYSKVHAQKERIKKALCSDLVSEQSKDELTISQVSEILCCEDSFVYRLIEDGLLGEVDASMGYPVVKRAAVAKAAIELFISTCETLSQCESFIAYQEKNKKKCLELVRERLLFEAKRVEEELLLY